MPRTPPSSRPLDGLDPASFLIRGPGEPPDQLLGVYAEGAGHADDREHADIAGTAEECVHLALLDLGAVGQLPGRQATSVTVSFDPLGEFEARVFDFAVHDPLEGLGEVRLTPVGDALFSKRTQTDKFGSAAFSPWNLLSAQCTPSSMTSGEDFESAKTTVGSRIRKRRERQKLTQEALADLARVDRKHMSSIENGKAEPGFWTLTRIAIALQTTTATFVRGLAWDPETDKYGHPREGDN